MKNESGANEDITMLDALRRLWNHKAKRKTIRFEVTFDDVTRKVVFGKIWSSSGEYSVPPEAQTGRKAEGIDHCLACPGTGWASRIL